MRSVPIIGILGFVFGCCLTVIVTILFMPADYYSWPSTYESRLNYLEDITLANNYTYRSGLFLYYNALLKDSNQYDTEEQYLTTKARMLCYSIEQEADDETHASLIVTTWSQHCDKMILFYSSPRLLEKLNPRYLKSEQTKLIYIDSYNSTIKTLLTVLKPHITEYSWFIYVPAKVFLLPDNLKYFLTAAPVDPDHIAFVGKPEVDKLFGSWEVSESSPLAMSAQAIRTSLSMVTYSCSSDNIQDPGCLIEDTKVQMLNIRNDEGNEVITSILYNNFWIKYGNVNVKDSIKMHFPVSVYVRGDYKNFLELEYYFHHLSAYGIQSIQGGLTKGHSN